MTRETCARANSGAVFSDYLASSVYRRSGRAGHSSQLAQQYTQRHATELVVNIPGPLQPGSKQGSATVQGQCSAGGSGGAGGAGKRRTCCTSMPRASRSVVMRTREEPERNSRMMTSRVFCGRARAGQAGGVERREGKR